MCPQAEKVGRNSQITCEKVAPATAFGRRYLASHFGSGPADPWCAKFNFPSRPASNPTSPERRPSPLQHAARPQNSNGAHTTSQQDECTLTAENERGTVCFACPFRMFRDGGNISDLMRGIPRVLVSWKGLLQPSAPTAKFTRLRNLSDRFVHADRHAPDQSPLPMTCVGRL